MAEASQATQGSATRRGGRPRGAEGYSEEDVLAMLTCIRDVLPTGGNEWDKVLQAYRQTHATRNGRYERDVASIKKKYQGLLNAKKPTGSPTCPFEYREAQTIQREIRARVSCATLNTAHPASVVDLSAVEQESTSTMRQRQHQPAVTLSLDRPDTSSDEGSDDRSDDDVTVMDAANAPDAASHTLSLLDRIDRILEEEDSAPPTTTTATQAPTQTRPSTTKQTRKPKVQSKPIDNGVSTGEAIQSFLTSQPRQREISNGERFLQMQLTASDRALEHERKKRKKMEAKVETLEATIASLREQKDALRDRLIMVDMEKRDLREQFRDQFGRRASGQSRSLKYQTEDSITRDDDASSP